MKAIVFGGSGFLGGHVADALTHSGYEVTIFDIAKSTCIQDGQKMIQGDVLDREAVLNAVRGNDIVYNFAGIADLDESQVDPLKTIEVNVVGNLNILNACLIFSIKRYIFASSLYIYSKTGSFYKTSKQSCELVIESYHEEYGLPYTILRFGSLYGPRANKHNWILKILTQAIRERKITREGDGEELREYVHVEDAAACSVDILSKEFENKHIIITGHQQIKTKHVMLMIKEMLGDTITLEFVPAKSDLHYQMTPYSFVPKIAKKYIRSSYLDLGQGILHCIEEIHRESHPKEYEECHMQRN